MSTVKPIASVSQLQSFFCDAIPGDRCQYRGVDVELFEVGRGNLAAGFLFGFWYSLFGRATQKSAGHHLRIHFRSQVASNFRASKRATPIEHDNALFSTFSWVPVESRYFESLCGAPIERALITMAERYTSVEYTNQHLSFGPLLGTPRESAEALHQVFELAGE